MATYTPPTRLAHGDHLTAATLNSYSLGIVAIRELTGPYSFNVPVKVLRSPDEDNPMAYTFLHVHRWLHYLGAGTITDVTADNTSSLGETPDGVEVFDLQSVSWLAYGEMYKVLGVTFACEVMDNVVIGGQTSGE